MKVAFAFSGQGAQYQGMGQELYAQEPIVKATFDEAEAILGYSVAELCFDDPEEKLNQTAYTQPAILTLSVACWRLLTQRGYKPTAVLGLSLGEYSALVASGALSFADGLRLVAERGRVMQAAVPAGIGKMVAVMNAEVSLIEACCEKATGIVVPANYNTPQQIVIGGEIAAVDEAVTLLQAEGVKRMIPLNVNGPFHTPLLKGASEQFAQTLEEQAFAKMQVPVISNTTAQMMPDEQVKSLLARQMWSAVRFYESIQTLDTLAIEAVIELGPGKTLTGFVKKINKNLAISRIEDSKTLAETLTLLSGR